jgi:ABC-type transport system involved in cytochrome c biogenesis ATPase subunit
MWTLEIVLEEKFKSFHKWFKETLDWDLILLSWVNWSWKSQLLRIMTSFADSNWTRINSYIKINWAVIDWIEWQRIIYKNLENIIRSDREKVNFVPRRDQKYLKSIEDNAWAIYKQRNSGYYQEAQKVWVPHFDNYRYSLAVNRLYNLMKDKFPLTWNRDTTRFSHPVQENMLGYPTEEEFRTKFKTLENIYEFWQPDDFFSEEWIIDLFYNYAERRLNYIIKKYLKENKEERFSYDDLCKLFASNKDSQDRYLRSEWCQKAKEEFETKNPPPWELLNKQLSDLWFTYKFADDYEIHNSNIVWDVKLLDKDGSAVDFALGELSDWEFAIFSLALASLRYESLSWTLKLLLLDEYDAIFNPSLIEVFYEMLENFFIKKWVIVVIATHSTATIALAPKLGVPFKRTLYEINKPDSWTERILSISDSYYEEVKIAHEHLFRTQKEKIKLIKSYLSDNKTILFVEGPSDKLIFDKWLELFNLAEWIKVISMDWAQNARKYQEYVEKYFLRSSSKVIFIFDYDHEWNTWRRNLKHIPKATISNSDPSKHSNLNIHSRFLPIPLDKREYIGNKVAFFTIEQMFYVDKIGSYFDEVNIIGSVSLFLPKDDKKMDFAKSVLSFGLDEFRNFKELFEWINNL